jgi:hypothetical protein
MDPKAVVRLITTAAPTSTAEGQCALGSCKKGWAKWHGKPRKKPPKASVCQRKGRRPLRPRSGGLEQPPHAEGQHPE